MTAPSHPPALRAALARAHAALDAAVDADLPSLGPAWRARSAALSPGGDRAAYFLDAAAFPTVQLGHWLAADTIEDDVHESILGSNIAGYWAIRITDQVVDEGAPADRALVPLLGLLHSRFWEPHRRLLGPGSAFWAPARRWWHRAADAAVAEAQLAGAALDPGPLCARLWVLAPEKTGAVRIPLLALHLLGSPPGTAAELPPAWAALVAATSRVHQLHNDWSDWRRDHARGPQTGAQAWARAEAGAAEPAAWWATTGAERMATTVLVPALDALDAAARAAAAPEALAWSAARRALLRRQLDQLRRAQAALRALFGAAAPPASPDAPD